MRAIWKRTDDLFSLLRSPAVLLKKPLPHRHALMFYRMHMSSLALAQRNLVLKPVCVDPRWDALFVRGIDPSLEDGSCHDHSCPLDFDDWPSPREAEAYNARVRQLMLDSRAALRASALGRQVWDLVAEHEMCHQDTLPYMLALLPLEDLRPGARGPASVALPQQSAWVTGGVLLAGASGRSFVWDNELPRHEVRVEGFALQRRPVTNGEYLAYCRLTGASLPQQMSEGHSILGVRVREMLRSYPIEERLHHPVMVSWRQAHAYVTAMGMRLPSEHEWTHAARGHWRLPRNNVDMRRTEAIPSALAGARGGLFDMVGNGYEHTSSVFAPFPGFRPQPTYPNFSTDFFCPPGTVHMVYKGASWATALPQVRPSYRNFFQPDYCYTLSKFRGAGTPAGELGLEVEELATLYSSLARRMTEKRI